MPFVIYDNKLRAQRGREQVLRQVSRQTAADARWAAQPPHNPSAPAAKREECHETNGLR